MTSTVETEIRRLQELGIITLIDYSEWTAPIVVVKKQNGKIRICADYSIGLNPSLEPNQFPLPLPEEIFTKNSGCKICSKIDLSDDFLQVKVEEKSFQV